MSGHRIVRANYRYHVENDDGERVSGFFTNLESAQLRMERIAREAARCVRPCITCAKRFTSEGKHNRMCGDCRTSDGTPDHFGIVAHGSQFQV